MGILIHISNLNIYLYNPADASAAQWMRRYKPTSEFTRWSEQLTEQ